MKEAVAVVDLTDATTKVRRLLQGLDREGKPFSVYDPYYDTIVVIINLNYKVSRQCPKKNPLVLFEEDHEDAGNKPIVGFQIKNVQNLCRKYNLPLADKTVRVSQILVALGADNIGLCGEVAVRMATELVRKYDELDTVEFPK